MATDLTTQNVNGTDLTVTRYAGRSDLTFTVHGAHASLNADGTVDEYAHRLTVDGRKGLRELRDLLNAALDADADVTAATLRGQLNAARSTAEFHEAVATLTAGELEAARADAQRIADEAAEKAEADWTGVSSEIFL